MKNLGITAVLVTKNGGWGSEKEAIKDFAIGDKFELIDAEVRSSISFVKLKGIVNSVNSVFFHFYNENGDKVDIYQDERFYDRDIGD